MNRLNVLLLEDDAADAELIVAELRRAGFDPVWRRVTDAWAFLDAIGVANGATPDIILADYNLPQFTGLQALDLLQARGLDIPFILISGTVGEDVAVEVMKRGATDYLLKDRLTRLGPSVRQALTHKELRDSKRQIEETLRRNEQRFRTLIESSTDAIALIDPEGIILYASPSTTAVTGYTPDEFVGRSIFEFIHLDDAERAMSDLLGLLQQRGITATAELRARHKDGSWRWYDFVGKNQLADPAIQAIVVNYRDITDRKQAEVELLRRHRHQKALNAVIVAASSADDVDQLLAGVLTDTLSALELRAGAIWLGNHSTTAGIGNEVAARVDLMTREAGMKQFLGDVIVEDWNAGDRSDTERLFAPIAAQRIRATLAVPIVSGDQRIGAVAVLSEEPRRWVADDVVVVKSIARELGAAMERRWAQQRILQQLENLTTLYASAKKLSESLNLEDLTDYVVRTAVESFGVRAAAIRRAAADGALHLLASYPPGAWHHRQVQLRWDDVPESLGPGGRALRSGLPVVVHDVNNADISADRAAALRQDGIRSTVSIPLISRDKPFGLLSLYSAESEFFRPARVEHYQAFANLVAAALENARLFDEAQRRLDQLQALRDIDTAISGSLDARVTLNIFLDKVTTHLRVDAADILLLNPRSQTLEFLTGRGFRTTALQHTRLRLGAGYAGQAALERRTISVPNLRDAQGGLERSPQLADEEFISYFAAPLIAKGQAQGVLEVFHRQPLTPDEEWMDFLSTLAGQAAIAIDSTTLFDNLQRANLELTLAYDTTLEGWSKALDLRDKETEGHTQRVAELTLRLARAMGMVEDDLVHVRRGALLHDIGKMGIPDSILLKPGPLSEDEWEIMRRHPAYAYQLLSPISYLHPALPIPYAHHEKWDGSGYPRGLKGEEIPLEARIFAVVDVWDALTSDRPYRPAWPKDKTREYINEQAAKHFDPRVAEVFLRMLADMISTADGA